MPSFCIVPAAAVADERVTDTQFRVLCAVGTFTNKLGGTMWASVSTLAKAANVSPRTVQRALPALLQSGYLRHLERPGRTTLYEIVLDQGVTLESGGGDTRDGGGVTQESPERIKERKRLTKGAAHKDLETDPTILTHLHALWTTYPPRSEPYVWVPVRKAFFETIQQHRIDPARLVRAAHQYALQVQRQQTEPRYVRGLVSFLRDEVWRQYDQPTVHGRTREEWARSGQDVAEFDRLAQESA